MLPVSIGAPSDNVSSAIKSLGVIAPPLPVNTNETARATPTQLANAVLATGAPAAYAPETPQPPKSTLRATTVPAPSSALAAQYFAQIAETTEEDLTLFAVRSQGNTDTAVDEREAGGGGDDFLTQLRAARGDKSPAAPTLAAQTPPSGEPPAVITAATEHNAIRAGRAEFTGLPAALSSQFITRLPPPLLNVGGAPHVAKVKGTAAYQLANARNAGRTPTVTAVL